MIESWEVMQMVILRANGPISLTTPKERWGRMELAPRTTTATSCFLCGGTGISTLTLTPPAAGPSLLRLRQYCHKSISNLSSSSSSSSSFIIRFSSDKNKSVLSTTDTIFSSSPSLRFQHHQLKRRRTLRISSNTAGDIINVPLPLGGNDNVVLLQTKKKATRHGPVEQDVQNGDPLGRRELGKRVVKWISQGMKAMATDFGAAELQGEFAEVSQRMGPGLTFVIVAQPYLNAIPMPLGFETVCLKTCAHYPTLFDNFQRELRDVLQGLQRINSSLVPDWRQSQSWKLL